jgi:hypothetical protein
MKGMLRVFSLLLLCGLLLGTGVPAGQAQEDSQPGQEKSQKEKQEKKKKKSGGFFSGLKAVTGESSEQQEVTATAGSKTVGEGERIGDAQPTAADRQAVSAMENYTLSPGDVKKFQDDGQLKPKQ